MRPSLFRLLPIIPALILVTTLANTATACEGECITGVTNAWKTNHTKPLYDVLFSLANEIVSELIPDRTPSPPPISLLHPILFSYQKTADVTLERMIFPSFFHGKCQRADHSGGPAVNPPGCPNPDCPVVCGTPGSMVHFFPKLCHIAFTGTQSVLATLTDQNSEVMKEVMEGIVQEAEEARRRNSKRRSLMGQQKRGRGTREAKARRGHENRVKGVVKKILSRLQGELEKVCGGPSLSHCCWEKKMKEYILSFP